MRGLSWLVLSVVMVGCASARPDKIPFAELFPPAPEASAEGPELSATQRLQQAKVQARLKDIRSKALRQTLQAFVTRAKQYRAGKTPREFDAQVMKNWLMATDAADAFLNKNASASQNPNAGKDARLARALLELELELDIQTFTRFPPSLVQSTNERLGALAMASFRTEAAVASGEFAWPIHPVSVTSLFGRRMHPVLRQHRVHFGVDLRAASGQPVLAAADGRVVRAAWNRGHGNQVELIHEGGIVTRYSHLSKMVVREGATVRQGDLIGGAGSTGQSTGVHLHFEFWRRGVPCDPLEELTNTSQSPRMALAR